MLSVVILAFNRRDALRSTLRQLAATLASEPHETIVADNASSDGTLDMLRAEFPHVRALAMPTNLGVEAFNRAAASATGDELLILDDDAWPDPASLRAAREAMALDPSVGAVALCPIHPRTHRREWPQITAPSDACPIMGCANLVRTEAWRRVGGYESAFFLYRNDTDLALKLGGAGYRVLVDPAWFAWHDSPATSVKSDRWLELATRNWCWLARRHGTALTRRRAIALGVLWACVQAGLDPDRLTRVFRGAWHGCMTKAPPLPRGVPGNDAGLRALIALQTASIRRRLA